MAPSWSLFNNSNGGGGSKQQKQQQQYQKTIKRGTSSLSTTSSSSSASLKVNNNNHPSTTSITTTSVGAAVPVATTTTSAVAATTTAVAAVAAVAAASSTLSLNNDNATQQPQVPVVVVQQQQPLLLLHPPPLNRTNEAMKQLLCGGLAGSVAKTITAPFSRLTILFQVHSLVTTKEHRPKFAMSLNGGMKKIIERGGYIALWKGNMTSVLHRFPYSAINFYMYENTMDFLTVYDPPIPSAAASSTAAIASTTTTANTYQTQQQQQPLLRPHEHDDAMTQKHLVRRMTRLLYKNQETETEETDDNTHNHHHHRTNSKTFIEDDDDESEHDITQVETKFSSGLIHHSVGPNTTTTTTTPVVTTNNTTTTTNFNKEVDTPAYHKFLAGAIAGTSACTACYPLDLVRTRITTEFEGKEHYRGIVDAFTKIYRSEGFFGFYSGIGPTLLVAVPNFGISYTVYGTLKEYTLDDDLFYNLRKVNHDSGETKLGFLLTVFCGATSGIFATLVTFPMDTIRRRMQVQNLHVSDPKLRMNSIQQVQYLIQKEGLKSLYRGLTPEILKVIPMVGTMFTVYETTKDLLNVTHERNR